MLEKFVTYFSKARGVKGRLENYLQKFIQFGCVVREPLINKDYPTTDQNITNRQTNIDEPIELPTNQNTNKL